MATKQQAIRSAEDAKRHDPKRPMYIYRVGPAWMFTGRTRVEVQAAYKVRVADYQEVTSDVPQ